MACNLARFWRRPCRTRNVSGYLTHKNYSDHSKKSSDGSEEVTKESLQWRTPQDQMEGAWYSKLKVFSSDSNNVDIIKFLQSPIDLSPTAIKKWWHERKVKKEIALQQFIPKRNEILGDNLAAAHFIIFRGGSIKFEGEDWIRTDDEDLASKLPNVYVRSKVLNAIDCSNMNLYYEGLSNLRGLHRLKTLSLYNCSNIDDWCLDRISGLLGHTLTHLDLRKCSKITDRGLGAVYKMEKLKTLLLDDFTDKKSIELTCLMLQELLPELDIKYGN